MFKRRKRRQRISLPEISLTPLIDTALTLLIIFMVTAPVAQNNIKIDLPHGASKEAFDQQELVITLHKDNTLYFNSYPINKEELIDAVKKELAGREEKTPVYLRADASLAYGNVIELIDKLKMAGVRYVAMSTRAAVL